MPVGVSCASACFNFVQSMVLCYMLSVPITNVDVYMHNLKVTDLTRKDAIVCRIELRNVYATNSIQMSFFVCVCIVCRRTNTNSSGLLFRKEYPSET